LIEGAADLRNPPLEAVLSRHTRRLAICLGPVFGRVRSGRVGQVGAGFRRGDNALRLCFGLCHDVGTVHAAQDRQYPGARNYCPSR
jgi:transposase